MTYTPAQLRDLRDAIDAHLAGKPVEYTNDGTTWTHNPCIKFDAIGHGLYRPKREPETRPWSKPEDVPMPVCWIKDRRHGTLIGLVHSVNASGFATRTEMYTWADAKNAYNAYLSHSTDGREWKPLTVTV